MKDDRETPDSYAGPSLFLKLPITLIAIAGLVLLGAKLNHPPVLVAETETEFQSIRLANHGQSTPIETSAKIEAKLLPDFLPSGFMVDPIPVSLTPDTPPASWSEADYLAHLSGENPKMELVDLLTELRAQSKSDQDIDTALKSLHDRHANCDLEEVVNWVIQARQSPNGIAYEIGQQFKNNLDFENAYHWYQISAKQDKSAQANYQLGSAEILGHGTSIDYTKAKVHLYSAMNDDHPDAAYLLGIIYQGGLDTQANPKLAYQLFQTAIARGSKYGFAEAAKMREQGTGVSMDKQRAVEIYQAGAKVGDQTCIHRLKELKADELASLSKQEF